MITKWLIYLFCFVFFLLYFFVSFMSGEFKRKLSCTSLALAFFALFALLTFCYHQSSVAAMANNQEAYESKMATVLKKHEYQKSMHFLSCLSSYVFSSSFSYMFSYMFSHCVFCFFVCVHV